MSVRVAINGFGRTGRAMFLADQSRSRHRVVAGINDVIGPLPWRSSSRNDSVYGRFPGREAPPRARRVHGIEIPVFAETDPAELPWRDVGVDVVIESTGRFRARAAAGRHLEAGARKVIISAPAKGESRWMRLVLG